MWWRFHKHRVAVASGIVVAGFYLVVLGADFLAYADPNASEAQRSLMPPQPVHWFDGGRFRPHVYAVKGARDPETFKRVYRADPTMKISIRTIPLWMGLAAALPRDWSILQIYFAITVIISLLGWTELARVVRGRFLALREEDFVVSARLVGCTQMRTIFVHMVPSFMSHIIAATTLALPAMIISETALSFLGLGLRPPAISWGVLLQQAQNVQTVAISPWLMLPAVPVIVVVMAFNFLGDGLRDASDPYGR